MDVTAINVTIANREVWKGEETFLCQNIYLNLTTLFNLHKPHEELKKLVSKDTFTKSNSTAFPHVLHYLFVIYSPSEFKKRFFWPLQDKKSENNFRTATVQYLNELNEKFQLGFEPVRSYIVVMPGGMKFMRVLDPLIAFVIKEERRKLLAINPEFKKEIHSDLTITEMVQDTKRKKEEVEKTKEMCKLYTKEIRSKTQKMKEMNADLMAELEFLPEDVKNEIVAKLKRKNEETEQLLYKINILGQRIKTLNSMFDSVEVNFNAGQHLDDITSSNSCHEDKILDICKLIDRLELIVPSIIEGIVWYENKRAIMDNSKCSDMENVNALRQKINVVYDQIEEALSNKFQTIENITFEDEGERNQNKHLAAVLIDKVVATPPLQFNSSLVEDGVAIHGRLFNLEHNPAAVVVRPVNVNQNSVNKVKPAGKNDDGQRLNAQCLLKMPNSCKILHSIKKDPQRRATNSILKNPMTCDKNHESKRFQKFFFDDIEPPHHTRNHMLTPKIIVESPHHKTTSMTTLQNSPTGKLSPYLSFNFQASDTVQSDAVPFNNSHQNQTITNVENNRNASNIILEDLNSEDESIFNTSDSVLKDSQW